MKEHCEIDCHAGSSILGEIRNAKLEIVDFHIYRCIGHWFLHGMRSDRHQGDYYHNRVWRSTAAGAGCDASTFVVIGDYDHDDYLEPGWRGTEAIDHDLFTSVKLTSH